MTKTDMIGKVQEKLNITAKQATETVDSVLDVMKECLATGNDLKIAGFGNFAIKDRAARRGKNPKTGAEITIAASRVLSFKPGKALKDSLNPEK